MGSIGAPTDTDDDDADEGEITAPVGIGGDNTPSVLPRASNGLVDDISRQVNAFEIAVQLLRIVPGCGTVFRRHGRLSEVNCSVANAVGQALGRLYLGLRRHGGCVTGEVFSFYAFAGCWPSAAI